jgi:allophanate hydrolase
VAGLETFIVEHADALHPVIREVLAGADRLTGVDVFRGMHALARARTATTPVWDAVDVLMVPTAPGAPLIEDVLADPIGENAALGRFTNFVNLLDLAGLAVPSTTTPAGVPVGVTFLGRAGSDALLAGLGDVWQRAGGLALAVTGDELEPEDHDEPGLDRDDHTKFRPERDDDDEPRWSGSRGTCPCFNGWRSDGGSTAQRENYSGARALRT